MIASSTNLQNAGTKPLTAKPRNLKKHQWIRDIVQGKTFADVGGLWGTLNETVSIANLAGASKATMIDIQPFHSKWWKAFHKRCIELNVTGYDSLQGNICDVNIARQVGKYDVVHCSGIIYHVPDPMTVIRNLVSITNEYLVLGSMLVPEIIDNKKGILIIKPGQMYHVPTMRQEERDIFGEYFSSINVKVGGLNEPKQEYISNELVLRTGPWWYLYTAETMRRMCEMFDLAVEDSWVSHQGAQNLLCKLKN